MNFWKLHAILFLLIPVSGLRADTTELDVCSDCNYRTVSEAVQQAVPGSVIVVHAGYYPEGTIEIDKSITIRGEGQPIIDGLGQGHIFWAHANGVVIESLVLFNSGRSNVSEFAGIRLLESKDCIFRKNLIVAATYGIYLERSSHCQIVDNRIVGESLSEVAGGNGIHLWYSTDTHIEGNTVQGHRDGLYMEFSDRLDIRNNTFRGNVRYGMHFMFSHFNHFRGNTFERNSTGVAIMYSHNIEVSENKFERSWGGAFYGILLKDISDSRIEGNIIEGNTTGVLLDSSNRNTISRNIFRDNGWAVDAYGNNYGNVVTGNSFLGNHFDVTTNSRRSENTYEGNYWDRHRGYDMDGDGYGDVVYRPMSVFALWVNRNSELAILMNSPVVDFLEAAERVFPVITPDNMLDARPLMQDPNTRDKE